MEKAGKIKKHCVFLSRRHRPQGDIPFAQKPMTEELSPSARIPHTLYLRLSDSRICFARYEMREKPYFTFSPYRLQPHVSLTVNLRTAVQSESILNAPIGETVVLVSGTVTPVPLADFQEEDGNAIYNYCLPNESPHRVFYDIVPAANVVLLYSLDEQTCRNIEEIFNNVRYVSSLTPVLRKFSSKGITSQPQKRFFIYCHEKSIDVAVFDDTHLLMVNSYPINGETDIAYYVLNLTRHMAVNSSAIPVYVAGEPAERNKAAETIGAFIPNVFCINPSGEFNRHIVSTTEGVPYDLMALLIEQ
mgnify:CR=1 FL=1|jgi:hypothetical protein